MDIFLLDSAIRAVCPIDGVSVGDELDKTTWRIDFADTATSDQKTAAQNVIDAFNPDTKPPASILSQDLMAQFVADDLTKIKVAIDANIQFWGLWSAMQAQKDPMIVTSARFLQGWNALIQVLGQPRMNAIAAALNVMVG